MRCLHKAAVSLSVALLTLAPLDANPNAAKTNLQEQPPAISDSAVPRYLNISELREWERAQEQLRLGQSLVNTGEHLISRPPSALRSAQDIAKDKEDGKRQIEDGKRQIQLAEQTLNRLRQSAAAAATVATVKTEPAVYPMDLVSVSLDKCIKTNTEALLFDLWNQGYGRIYFGGTYIMDTADEDPIFLSDPVLNKDFQRIISRLDGNRFTFVNDDSITFRLNTRQNRTIIDFDDRNQILRHFKAAFIIAELVVDSQENTALLFIRGIDLSSMNIAAAQLAVLTIDDSVRKLMTDNSTAETPAAAEATTKATTESAESSATLVEVTTSPEIASRLAVQLRDDLNFIQRVASSDGNYIFVVEYKGDQTGFKGRAASMVSKKLLLDNKLNVTEADFLPMVLEFSSDAGSHEYIAPNAIWKVTPLSGGGNARTAYDVEAISLISGQSSSVPVGLMQTHLLENIGEGES